MGVMASMCGCADPAADTVVAWIDGREDADGTRSLEVYDRGARYSIDIVPKTPGSEPVVLSLEVDSRGDGVAVSDELSTSYVSFRQKRQPTLTSAAAHGRTFDASFRFARNGDAILRAFEAGIPGLAFMPTSSHAAGEVSVLEPPVALFGGVWQPLYASDAPVLFWVEQGGFPARATGRVEAIIYPSEHRGMLAPVDEPRVLGIGELVGRGVNEGLELRMPDDWCPGRTCASPDGRSLTAMSNEPCTILWWRWEDTNSATEEPTQEQEEKQRVKLDPEGCPALSDPHLFAQIEHDVVVLDDEVRIYVADLTTGGVKAGTKLWERPVGRFRMVRRGHAMTLISLDLEVLYIDERGVRTLNAERAPCPTTPLTTTSPSGLWTLGTCTSDGTFTDSSAGTIYRVSPLGLEVFGGIAMAPLAIDDEGNGLLYSFDTDAEGFAGAPRGLFVLTGDGQVARIDDLEPEPARVTSGDGRDTYFGLQFMRP